jgi:predicted lipoprotein
MISLVLIAVAVAIALPARAADDADYRRLNRAIVEQHIVPRYQQFAAATDRLAAAADQVCAAPRTAALDPLRETFVAALDAWQSIQHIRFGPVEFFSRGSRIAFWPDPRNNVGRQLDELLAKRDEFLLAPETFAKGSVAVQGFPALEILLNGEDAAARLRGDGADAAFCCATVKAIAHNLQTMARDIHGEWTGGDDPYARLLDRADDVRFRKPGEVTVELFKSLYTAVELVSDHKLARPMGNSVQAARPRLAESWRSKRSMDNIRRNLAAAQAMYDGAISAFVREVAGDAALDALLRRAFAQTLATANGIAVPLEDGVAKAPSRAAFDKLSREAKALKTLLVQRLAPALDVPVGFNQLDGD